MKKTILIILGVCAAYLGYIVQQPTLQYKDAAKIPDHQLWYSMQWQDNNVGFVKETWSKQNKYLQWSQMLKITGIARGRPFSRVSQGSLQFSLDYPYPLISGSWFVESQNQNQQFNFAIEDSEIKLSQGRSSKTLPYPTIWDAQQLWAPQYQALIASQHGERNIVLKQWDMQRLEAKNVQFSYGKMEQTGIIQAASHQQSEIGKKLWSFDSSGKLLSKSLGSAIKLVLTTEPNALQLTTTDVYQSSLLNVDQPLGEVGNISSLELEIGEKWQQNNQSETLITQHSVGAFLQIGNPGKYEQQAGDRFLKPSTRHPQSKRIKRMAAGLVSQQLSDYENTAALLNFTSEFIADDNQIKDMSVDEILDDPRGDCTEHALLFVTLARAAGLPAREVSGLLYLGDEQQKYSAHVWAEVEIEGHWLSVDPTWRKMQLDPGYIRVFGESAANTTALLALSGKTIHVKNLTF